MGTEAINGATTMDVAFEQTEHAAAAVDASPQENIDARQQIRATFVDVAKDERGGVGSDKAERRVDQMLYDMLPKIDFSRPGGSQYASEISDFIRSMGHKMSKGEIKHLEGLLNEAAAALPPQTAAAAVDPGPVAEPADPGPAPQPDPSPAPDDDIEARLLDLLNKLVAASEDGTIDESERKSLLEEIASLTEALGSDGAEPAAVPPAGADEGAGAGAAAEDSQGILPGGCHRGDEPTDRGGSDDKMMLGLIRLLLDMMGAQEDGQIDKGERTDLLKDLASVMKGLLEDSGGAPDVAQDGGADAPTDAQPRPDNKMHDAAWYFDQTGLSDFLSGYLGEDDSGISDLVRRTLGDSSVGDSTFKNVA